MKPLALVAGALANKPNNGGAAWTRLSWALGLRRMGYKVRFLETLPAESAPGEAYRPGDSPPTPEAFFDRVLEDFQLQGALLKEDGPEGHPRWDQVRQWASQAAFLLNITGHLRQPSLLKLIRRKAYLDLDPGYTQIWHLRGADLGLQLHDHHFTIGENIGRDFCPIPSAGFHWVATRQPSLWDEWPETPSHRPSLFTTVASWRNPYGNLEYKGVTYGQKAHEFRRFLDLPQSVDSAAFELALDIHPGDNADRRALVERGWRVVDARRLRTPQRFRRYVQDSGAEFSVAQGAYAHLKSGWFSDRTARYLSSGRPALVQDTGLKHNFPLGEGLVTFRRPEEAIQGARRIIDDYSRHSRCARRLAESHFDYRKILGDLLERIEC